MTEGFAVGVDIGGTTTRALVLSLGGAVVGRGTSGGANPNSHPPELAAKRVAEAVVAAFGTQDPALARHCVLGVAGVSKLSDPAVARQFTSALESIGLSCPVTALSDAEVAFASATPEPDGTVLVGGTGSIAVRIVNHRKDRVVGGYGWLLGDEGSAYWIGREAVRATLRTLMSGAEIGPLAAAVLAEALGPAGREATYAQLITAANAEPPIRLARFAPLVSAHMLDDDDALEIVIEAAELLSWQALQLRTPGERTPIVLVGSVVGQRGPVRDSLRMMLTERTDGPVLDAADGAAGAAWLAAMEVLGPDAPRP
ncbi:MAG TPA: BadF/BadG/BcrA/BcrD ATPase family protein [Actinophytocola sp.]|uniref:N-acetylglucosamine kinase n=1 Tax=Actinophytocola sp. TaxID=1872138 RepID=UPI002DDD07FD|nr:BadF/BadG/BcrA/BcrD ATPase family protein [Actinophytocola sp.]HEV2780726.1 BadF/BadG/BcrA/BcrD ATPase family protein [Actinophytocola sp.]